MQPDNLWRLCDYMASPKSIVPGFQKLAKELRAGELWWYHFGHPDMPVEHIHPSRRMLLLCKPLLFVLIGPLRQGAWMKCNDPFQCDSLGLQSPGSPGLPIDCMQACKETLDLLDCSNFRNFTHDDRCTLA